MQDALNSVVFYVRCLAAPIQRSPNDTVVQHGGTVFTQLGCATCAHQPTLTTGYSPIAALSYQSFSPFTRPAWYMIWGQGWMMVSILEGTAEDLRMAKRTGSVVGARGGAECAGWLYLSVT